MRRSVPAALLGALLVSGLLVGYAATRDYHVSAVLPNAGNLFVGGSVMVDGYEAGSITDISVEDGRALVEMSLDDEFAPLHDGAAAEVVWKAALGERLLVLTDGPEANSDLPEGSLLTGVQAEPVELDAVLSTLDAPTRERVSSLVSSLQDTLQGREVAANESLRTAGPALRELGAILRGLNTDGAAIEQLVQQFDQTMQIIAQRDDSLEQVVTSLSTMTGAVATQDEALGATLDRMPEVLRHATETLGRVPSTVTQTLPMLGDLADATSHLGPVAANLRPLLADLQPTVASLRPTLEALSELLGITPGLMSDSIATVPAGDQALSDLAPALDFLRPYAPEIAGWATNWGSAAGNYDSNGHYTRFHIQGGLESGIGPGSIPGPGVTQNLTPAPGAPVGQAWTDAFGSEMR